MLLDVHSSLEATVCANRLCRMLFTGLKFWAYWAGGHRLGITAVQFSTGPGESKNMTYFRNLFLK
jgi:hypothetical protein